MIPHRIRFPLASLVVVVSSMISPVSSLAAGKGDEVESRVRERAQALVDKHAVLGMAIGVVRGDAITNVFVGKASAAGLAPDENTLFEIGSISKAFAGILLADEVVRGEVQLDQPVSNLLGEDVAMPAFAGQPIRMIDLATQTSGLPRLPSNLVFVNPFNPYAHYHEDDLLAFLAEHKLARAPGKDYEYSNLGFGLLGFALAKHAGKSYDDLLGERICRPLALEDTTLTLSQDQQQRMASGISNLGLPAMNWDLPTLSGAGGIRSTLADMLVFLRANMHPNKTPLADAIRLSHEPRFTIHEPSEKEQYKMEIGLAWHITTVNDTTIVWHNGMTGGYASYLGLVPAKDVGLVVLGNTATSEIDKFAVPLLRELANPE